MVLVLLLQKTATCGLFIGDGRFYNTGKTKCNAIKMEFISLNKKDPEEAAGVLKSIK